MQLIAYTRTDQPNFAASGILQLPIPATQNQHNDTGEA